LLPDLAKPVRDALRLKAEHATPGCAAGRLLARGKHWTAQDVVCSSGPRDRPFEERHNWVSIAVVVAGNFTYRSSQGRSFLSPGAVLLGNAGTCFTCGHDHGEGDRCIAFHFEPGFFQDTAAAAGSRRDTFEHNSLPALRRLAPFAARAAIAAAGGQVSFEELGLELAAATLEDTGPKHPLRTSPHDEKRVADVIGYLGEHFSEPCTLGDLARRTGLSPYHFLRIFRATTGLTPHQHLLRARLRAGAAWLAQTKMPVTEVALGTGFQDLSNFTRSFRAEYDLSPTQYRNRSKRR
jgi:AraC family transcriptional regulator